MRDMISAIEQEAKYMQKSKDGTNQYRRGYVHALQAVSEFLMVRSEQSAHDSQNPAVERLVAFVALKRNPGSDHALLARTDSGIQRDPLEIAAEVLRRSDENADFLNWWLDTYGRQARPSAGYVACPIFPDYPAPTTEAELDLLEDKFNRRYPEVQRAEDTEGVAAYQSANISRRA